MKPKQLLLFVVLGGAAVGGLIYGVGSWKGQVPTDRQVAKHTTRPDAPTVDENDAKLRIGSGDGGGAGLEVAEIKGVFIQAPPEFVVWNDPDNPGDPVEISTYYAWTFSAKEVKPLARKEGEEIGALCVGVEFRAFRRPRTHVEALSLARQDRDAQDAVLHRRIEADEARVFGKIAAQLLPDQAKDSNGRKKFRLGRDSEIRFSNNLKIHDADEGLDITGEEITAYPKLGTATGQRKFVLRHAAFVISGTGIVLNKIDDGRAVAEIVKNASLQLLEDPRAKASDAASDFRRATVTAEGGAVVRRDELVAGERLRIDMHDHVHLEQEGGRTLDTQRLLVEAIRDRDPNARTDARSGGWRLRRLEAQDDVFLKEIDEQPGKRATLLTARTERLVHDVPAAGAPTTLFEGATALTFEGDVPVDGTASKDGMLRASCRDRLWIRPVANHPGIPGVPLASLRSVRLIGDARLERHGRGARPDEDILEGDEVELIFFSDPLTKDKPATNPGGPDFQRATALEFTAKGHVRLGGTRINGTMEQLIGRNLATARPKISAIGKGTRLSFPEIRTNQRLVGRDPKPAASRDSAGPATADAPKSKGSWQIRRMTATGSVDVTTSLGGPALGVATHLTGHRLTYEEMSNLARLEGNAGQPAFVSADSQGASPNTLRAQVLSVDRRQGVVSAKGGVKGQLWTAKQGLGPTSVRRAFRQAPQAAVQVLEVATDERIDVQIVRAGPSGGVELDTEQLVTIHGPLVAELRADRNLIDRLRADDLELALVLASKPTERGGARQFPGFAKAPRTPGASGIGGPKTPATPPALMRLDIDAGEVVADIEGGTAKRVQALGGVRLASEMGEVLGARVVYDAAARTVDVLGDATRKAEAWFATKDGLRNEVEAARFVLTLDDDGAQRVLAQPPRGGGHVTARLFGQSKKPGERESYEIFARGPIDIRPRELSATSVVVDRKTSTDNGKTWSAPSRLWSPKLRVLGDNLLAAGPGKTRTGTGGIRQVIAEGDETILQTEHGADRWRIWGYRVVLDLPTQKARMVGSPGKDIVVRKGQDGQSQVDGTWREVTIDLETGLPAFVGPEIVIRPDK